MAFKKGQSGNPKGRPPAMAATADVIRAKLAERCESVIQSVIAAALEGDVSAAKLVLDRVCPPLKPRDGATAFLLPVNVPLHEQGVAVLNALAAGTLTALETSTILTALAAQARLVELHDLTKRIEALEGNVTA